ncbi:MAG: hypothetical protein RL456_1698 [Pseudomonadota bacterium]
MGEVARRTGSWRDRMRGLPVLAGLGALAAMLGSCGGGDAASSAEAGGPSRTYLSVAASDPDGDALHYQWRVTAGTIQNLDAPQTVWTLPDGPGVHFAYVTVTDGRGGHAVQQYAVATDALETPAPVPAARAMMQPVPTENEAEAGATVRLSLYRGGLPFVPASGTGAAQVRRVYLPDTHVEVVSGGTVHARATSDWRGQIALPRLPAGRYALRCTPAFDGTVRENCAALDVGGEAELETREVAGPPAGRNLRLHGHVALADGRACGWRDLHAGIEDAATVQLLAADGTPRTRAQRVNAYGDYAIDAAVGLREALVLQVRCGRDEVRLAVPVPEGGFVGGASRELSHRLPSRAPAIARVIATGPDGNVRGQMIAPEAGVASNGLPGAERFLAYKGLDTRASACAYYRAVGAVRDCDAQGRPIDAISFEDWKRERRFAPHQAGNPEVRATYINRMDLNLVRRMVATRAGERDIGFYVCNHPGPSAGLPAVAEIDEVVATALADERQVACVAMDWVAMPGVNGGQPFTRFFTFGPDGGLLLSVNLDGRGEKFMPGACVACHGGSRYAGRFPQAPGASPNLGSNFLPFDTGNYLFASGEGLDEAAQQVAIHALNRLVQQTAPTPATRRLIDGWYASGTTRLDRGHVPPAWQALGADGQRFYREVIGTACRTCHTAMRERFDWDASPALVFGRPQVCGGSEDLERGASMANALMSHDDLMRRVKADDSLAALMTRFLGCTAPADDPAHPRR